MESDKKKSKFSSSSDSSTPEKTSSSSQISQKTKKVFKNLKGSLGRVKHKLMQNIGKADKSKDEVMESYIEAFNCQKKSINKLQESIKNYAHYSRSSHGAFQDLCEALLTIYVKEWSGHSTVESELHDLMNINHIYADRIHDDVVESIKKYADQFPSIVQKVNQLQDKLTDYDAARHNLKILQNAKNPEEDKIEMAKERVKQTWKEFEPYQNELCEKLPNLYDTRMQIFTKDMFGLFEAEMTFHAASLPHFQKLCKLMEDLARDSKTGCYDTPKRGPMLNPPSEIFYEASSTKKQKTPVEHPIEEG